MLVSDTAIRSVDPHPHGLSAPGETERVPLVPTVLPPTQFTTVRTRDGHPRGFDNQHQASSRSTTTRTMHQRSDSAPSGVASVTLLDGHASAQARTRSPCSERHQARESPLNGIELTGLDAAGLSRMVAACVNEYVLHIPIPARRGLPTPGEKESEPLGHAQTCLIVTRDVRLEPLEADTLVGVIQ